MSARRSAGFPVLLLLAATLLSLPAARCGMASKTDPSRPTDRARHTIPLDPKKLVRAPDPTRPLAERLAWARSEATRRGDADWTAVYTIQPVAWTPGAMYVGDATIIWLGNGDQVSIGGVLITDEPENLSIQGTTLRDVINGSPTDAAVILPFEGNSDQPDDMTVASLSLAHDFEDRTVYVLGPANDAESIDLARSWLATAIAPKEKASYVRLLGVHRSSDLVVPELAALLRGKETTPVRSEAAEWLGRHDHPASFPALDEAARRDRSHDVQREAVEALGELPDARGGNTLADILGRDESPDIRGEAAEALGERKPAQEAIAVLGRAAEDDPSESVRNEALEALVEMTGGAGLDAARRLALESPSSRTRRTAVEEVAPYLEPDEAATWLASILDKDDDREVRREAVETLGDLKSDRVVPILSDVAENDPDPDVRTEAVETMSRYPDDALNLFRRLVDREDSESVLNEICETALELDDKDAERFVKDLARHGSDPMVRRAAEGALESR